MRRLLIVLSIALLLVGQTLTSDINDILIAAEDDLIELHNEDKSII